ncbi:MAG: hypothetical protein ACTSRG_26105 [Candidatus Helarchaeota archaeon]
MRISIFENSTYINYSILSIKVAKVLRKIKKEKQIEDYEKDIITKGKKLLEKIIEGVNISQGDFSKSISYPHESISIYGYALSAIDRIERPNNKTSDFFNNIYTNLVSLDENKKIKNIDMTIDFFVSLNSYFSGEIRKKEYDDIDLSIRLNKDIINDYKRKVTI